MNEEKICCPKFEPANWDGRTFDWVEKKFITDKVFTLFYIPLNFGAVMTRLMKKTETAGAKVPNRLCLSEHTSKWNMDLFLAVDKEISGAKNTTFSGKFLCKVFEGEFKDVGKWMKEFEVFAKSKGVNIGKTYTWYTTCPKCAKKYGKNYVAIFGKIK
jgi:hypothetical protein